MVALSHQQIAKIYALKGDYQEASTNSLIALLNCTPLRINFYIDYIEYLFELKKYNLILDFIAIGFEHFPNHPLLLQWQIKISKQLNQIQQASEAEKKLKIMAPELLSITDNQAWLTTQNYFVAAVILGLVSFILGFFIVKNKKNSSKQQTGSVIKSQESKINKMNNNQHFLSNCLNLLLSKVEFEIKNLNLVAQKIEQNQKRIIVLQKEVDVMLNLSKKYIRYNAEKSLDQFQKYNKNFDSILIAYFNLEKTILNEFTEVKGKLTLLFNQLNLIKINNKHSSKQITQFEQLVNCLEQSADFKTRLEKAYEHIAEVYRHLETSFQKLKKDPKNLLEATGFKNINRNDDDYNNNNNESELSKKF